MKNPAGTNLDIVP